jgi:hypothetical protein
MSAPACPHCGRSDQVTLVSAFGGQIITAQWHCGACRTYFEALREQFEGDPGPARLQQQ